MARRPPLIADRCLRTVFISPICAPDFSSARLTSCLSAKVSPGAGRASNAEAPPEIRQRTRSSAVRPFTMSRMRPAAARPFSSGTGWAASTISMRLAGLAVAVARDDQPFERMRPAIFERARHGRTRLAGADHDRAALGRLQPVDVGGETGRGARRGKCCIEEVAQQGAGVGIFHLANLRTIGARCNCLAPATRHPSPSTTKLARPRCFCSAITPARPCRNRSARSASPKPNSRSMSAGTSAVSIRRSNLSKQLDAPLVASGYSRLVIDCNRWPSGEGSTPEISDTIPVPANKGLTREQVDARAEACFWPYHHEVDRQLDRMTAGRPQGLHAGDALLHARR